MIDFFGRRFRAWNNTQNEYVSATTAEVTDWCCLNKAATLVTSHIENSERHALVIDLDVPHHYEPSTTPGHGHLYINKQMSWRQCVTLLEALTAAGVVEQGFTSVSKQRGYASVRTPWTKKRTV